MLPDSAMTYFMTMLAVLALLGTAFLVAGRARASARRAASGGVPAAANDEAAGLLHMLSGAVAWNAPLALPPGKPRAAPRKSGSGKAHGGLAAQPGLPAALPEPWQRMAAGFLEDNAPHLILRAQGDRAALAACSGFGPLARDLALVLWDALHLARAAFQGAGAGRPPRSTEAIAAAAASRLAERVARLENEITGGGLALSPAGVLELSVAARHVRALDEAVLMLQERPEAADARETPLAAAYRELLAGKAPARSAGRTFLEGLFGGRRALAGIRRRFDGVELFFRVGNALEGARRSLRRADVFSGADYPGSGPALWEPVWKDAALAACLSRKVLGRMEAADGKDGLDPVAVAGRIMAGLRPNLEAAEPPKTDAGAAERALGMIRFLCLLSSGFSLRCAEKGRCPRPARPAPACVPALLAAIEPSFQRNLRWCGATGGMALRALFSETEGHFRHASERKDACRHMVDRCGL